eukprot:gb/GEZN01004404.1/.p1 GENE.gb/GEZN01004404.1/~~gb/GEZN01004404.1/.p1  ORF type:complete len:518 (+),score=87.35 gb/GEZN01004404.1/:94-1647(+)
MLYISGLLYCLSFSFGAFTSNTGWAAFAWGDGVEKLANLAHSEVVFVDLFDSTTKEITDYHSKGHKVICYYSAGTAEDWREDVISNLQAWSQLAVGVMQQWEGEVWLDITKLDALKVIMTPRLELAANKQCDGVDPDNVDCFANVDECQLGAGLTALQRKNAQIAYNRWTATTAHSLGLLIGLKNAGNIAVDMVNDYDFAVVEQCMQYFVYGTTEECSLFSLFAQQDKPIFGIEYKTQSLAACSKAVNVWHVQLKHCNGNVNQGLCQGTYWENCYDTPSWNEGTSTSAPLTTTTAASTTTTTTTVTTTTTTTLTTTPPPTTTTTPATTTTAASTTTSAAATTTSIITTTPTFAPSTFTTAWLFPSSFSVLKGTSSYGTGSVSRLALKVVSPTWNDYIEFYSNTRGKLTAEFLFDLPATVSPDQIMSLELSVHWMGPAKREAVWAWFVGDSMTQIGDNAMAPNWSWTEWSMIYSAQPASGNLAGIVSTKKIKVTMAALNSNSDDCDLDYLALQLTLIV